MKLAALLIALFTSFGCAGVVRDAAREAIPGALNGTLQGMNDPENQRLARQLLRNREVREASRDFVANVLDDSIAVLDEPARVARVEHLANSYLQVLMRAATRALAQSLRQDIGPALAQMMRTMMATMMAEIASERNQRAVTQFASAMTSATIDSATRSLAIGIERDIGPAIRRTVDNNGRTGPAIESGARSLVREAVLGGNDGIAQIEREQANGQRSTLLGRLTSATSRGIAVVQWVAVGAVMVSIVLALWLVRTIVRSRKARAESQQNAADALMLAEAIRATEGQSWSKEFTELVREQLNKQKKPDPLDEILKRRSLIPPTPRTA